MKKVTTKSASAILSLAFVLVYIGNNLDRFWAGYIDAMKIIFNF